MYTMDILTHDPELLCEVDGIFQKCTKEDVCLDDEVNPLVTYKIDWSSPLSLHNWNEEFGLMCSPSLRIAMFGSMLFLGYTFTGVMMQFMRTIPRKILFIVGQSIEVVAGLIICLSTSYWL